MKNLFLLAAASLLLLSTSCKEGPKESASTTDTTIQSVGTADTIFQTRFVLDDQYIILQANPDTSWATGAPQLSSNGNHYIYSTTKTVNEKMVPQSYVQLLNTVIQVADNKGKLIPAKIKSFRLYSGYTPHSGEVQRWEGNMDDGRKPYTIAEKTNEIWNNGTRYLVAALEVAKPGEEEEFVIAVPSTIKVSSLASIEDPSAVKDQIIPPLKKTVDYDTTAKAYNKTAGSTTGAWWEGEDGREVVTSFKGSDGALYTVINHVGGDPCGGDYYYEKLSIWKSAGDSSPQLLYSTNGSFDILSVTDIDQDNNPEFVLDNRAGMRILVGKQGETWVKQYTREVPNLDCGC